MPFIVSEDSGSPREMPEPGLCNAVCAYVEDLGVELSKYGKLQHRCVIGFELDQRMSEGENADKRFILTNWYTASLYEGSNLRRDLEAWRGRPFTPEELAGFDLETVLGVGATVNVVHGTNKAGKPKAEIASISPRYKAAEKMVPETKGTPPWVLERRQKNAEEEAKRNPQREPGEDDFDGAGITSDATFPDGSPAPF